MSTVPIKLRKFENLLREIREELGELAGLDVESLRYVGRFEDVAAGRTERIVEIDLYLGTLHGKLQASSEIKQLHWFGAGDDRARLSPIVRRKILPYLLRENFLSNWPTDNYALRAQRIRKQSLKSSLTIFQSKLNLLRLRLSSHQSTSQGDRPGSFR